MAYRFMIFTALVALSRAAPLEHHEHGHATSYASLHFYPSESYTVEGPHHHKEVHTVPHYEYKYGVHDPHHHDIKQHEESRKHEHTKGEYTIHDPHYERIVHYEVPDKHSGYIVDYKYDVKDPKHHNFHERAEKVDGHQITGHYTLVQPDGHKRIVHYTADKHNGFNAQVEYVKAH